MSDVTLKLDWCSHEAAKYAVEKWHYSHTMPKSKLAKIGAWENNVFIGCVIFGYGATPEIGKPYGLKQIEICELVRVALNTHQSPTSRIVSIALKMLRRQSSGLRLIVSYADTNQSHSGTIYQAMNWLYIGVNPGSSYEVLCPDGRYRHARGAIDKYGSCAGFPRKDLLKKHKYLYPLDDAMRKQIAPLSKPYPKRSDSMRLSSSSKTAIDQIEDSGANPTQTLSNADTSTHEIAF